MVDTQRTLGVVRHSRRKTFETTQTTHQQEPDYDRPLLALSEENRQCLYSRLTRLYGKKVAEAYGPELERILEVYYAHKPKEMIEN